MAKVAIEKKAEWDEDDPYQIPDSNLPVIKEGEITGKSEKPVKIKSKNSNKNIETTKPEENLGQPLPDTIIVQEQEKSEKKYKEKNNKNNEKSDTQQVVDENDPLRASSESQNKAKVEEKEVIYPSMHEIIKHVDEEKEKINPTEEKVQENAPKSKSHNREGHSSCKKCIIQ
ncbi:hypothetical protein SteCoe_35965 [Stentor coeruleus]|uniref:Uncharacterized protein n=1 Tax=Stentor coeruleus TaxID=5963 RepID=A0A1R2ARD4_9CILI|nr:hypothetical protein SteCoe_35965 [Stentor coeruleus]